MGKLYLSFAYLLLSISAFSILLVASPARAQQGPPIIPLVDSFKGDTARFLETNFNNRKTLYLNQKMSVLIKDLPLPIKSYSVSLNSLDTSGSKEMALFFSDVAVDNGKRFPPQGVSALSVRMQKILPITETAPIHKITRGAWLEAASTYFGDYIVEDVRFIPPVPVPAVR